MLCKIKEFPIPFSYLEVCLRISLLRVNERREEDGIADEEDRSVIANLNEKPLLLIRFESTSDSG